VQKYTSSLYLISALCGMFGKSHAQAALHLEGRSGAHFTSGRVSHGTGLGGRGKTRPPPLVLMPGSSSP